MAAIESAMLGWEERWIQHYSSAHSILLVGEGDFSFSLCLAMAFGSATNIVATTLDSYDQLIQKYKKAETNVRYLEILGATVIYGVDATSLNIYSDLQYQKFHRIIYNFPHVGFLSREDDPTLIDVLLAFKEDTKKNIFGVGSFALTRHVYSMHRKLVHGFFWNARRMLMVDGEIHINHKVAPPYNQWRIEDLARKCDLFLVELPVFSIKEYPGYENKRGSGASCDMPFNLGACRTFKFKLYLGAERILEQRSTLGLIHKMPAEFQEVPILVQHQAPPLKRVHPLGYDHVPQLVKQQTSNILISNECYMIFARYLSYVEETFGGETSHPLYQSVSDALKTGFRTYISSVPGATSSGYIGILEELRNLSIHRSEMLRQMLAKQVHADQQHI